MTHKVTETSFLWAVSPPSYSFVHKPVHILVRRYNLVPVLLTFFPLNNGLLFKARHGLLTHRNVVPDSTYEYKLMREKDLNPLKIGGS